MSEHLVIKDAYTSDVFWFENGLGEGFLDVLLQFQVCLVSTAVGRHQKRV